MRSKAPPVTAASPRWGFGKPEHPEIGAQIRRGIPGYRRFLAGLAERRALLHSIPQSTDSPEMPHWQNGYFSALDGAALVGFLLDWKPARYVEIGSGNSTKFARFAIRSANLPTHMTSIDPHPRAEIDAIVDRPIRAKLQDLRPGDLCGAHAGRPALLRRVASARHEFRRRGVLFGDIAPIEAGNPGPRARHFPAVRLHPALRWPAVQSNNICWRCFSYTRSQRLRCRTISCVPIRSCVKSCGTSFGRRRAEPISLSTTETFRNSPASRSGSRRRKGIESAIEGWTARVD